MAFSRVEWKELVFDACGVSQELLGRVEVGQKSLEAVARDNAREEGMSVSSQPYVVKGSEIVPVSAESNEDYVSMRESM